MPFCNEEVVTAEELGYLNHSFGILSTEMTKTVVKITLCVHILYHSGPFV